ncbi:glycosyltransferase family 2 protein [Cloacibacillus evryensis]|uniref:glycosyltransferase family 2 protein n=1 Tax=Cloacibacillus evryensis TaxID=508460 RepID=UPI002671BC37|nr:glycosyltransferase family 2 protein [Cloacibacillus evryensis]
MCLISIIIPVYNMESRLPFTLASVINQSFDNLEIIVVDDCSVDNGVAVAEETLKNSNRSYKIIRHNKNKGVSAARNCGLKAANGRYIAFIDGDDVIENNFVSALYEAISKSDSDFVGCGYKILELKDGTEERRHLQVSSTMSTNDILVGRILNKIDMSHCATLFRKEFLIGNDLFYEEGCTAGEDIEFLIKVLCRCEKPSFLNECLYVYVQHQDMGSRKEIKSSEKKMQRYLHHTEAHFREAEYIKKYTNNKGLSILAGNMILPQAYLRLLSVYAMNDDSERFNATLKSRKIRNILFYSYKSFLYKPEVFLRACVALYAPIVYYKKYRNYLND